MSVGAFTILKNEVGFVGYSIMSILDYVDELCYADGGSTDGSVELIEHIQKKYDKKGKIKLFKNTDCKNLKEDYTRLFNWLLKQCKSDYVMFWHCDMVMHNPKKLLDIGKDNALRYTVDMVSMVGREKYFYRGRMGAWGIIYKNDYGLHQHGHYGSAEEDFYFGDITGDDYTIYLLNHNMPYEVVDSGLIANHYCESKDYQRRLDKMIKSLGHQGVDKQMAVEIAKGHPRVTLESGIYGGVTYEIRDYKQKHPEVFEKYAYFSRFNRADTGVKKKDTNYGGYERPLKRKV